MAAQLLNGVLLGVTYALVALGFTLIVGVLDKLNLALGETFMVSAFVALLLASTLGLPFALNLPLAMVAGALIAVFTYVISFRAVNPEFFTAPILSTLGLGIVLSSETSRFAGSESRQFNVGVPQTNYDLGFAAISLGQVLTIVIGAVLTVLLVLLVRHSRVGMAIRAIAENGPVAGLLGVPVNRIILLTFAIAGLLAGAGGVLTGLVTHTVSPFLGFTTTLKGLTIIVIGGLGNIGGAIAAGLAVGIIETFSVVYLSATARDLIVFGLLIVFLAVRPQGLFGTKTHVERV